MRSIESKSRHILIIDDDRDQAEVLSISLTRLGFETLLAHDIRSGTKLAHTASPQLVILDIRLPDGNGLELCRELGDDPRTFQTPVIILSGMEQSDIVRRARTAGCRYFLRKPYDPNSLLLLVEDTLTDSDLPG